MLGEFPFIGELLHDLHTVPVITDGSPIVLDDIDINRGSLELREVSASAAAKPKVSVGQDEGQGQGGDQASRPKHRCQGKA